MAKDSFYFACIIGIYIGCIFTVQTSATPSEAIAACPCQDRKQAFPESQKEDTDQSSLIETRAGETISITLDSNPTTGYQWQLAYPVDEKILKFISSEYKASETKLVGAGGKEVWSFNALSSAYTTITFEYVRPWEKGKKPIKKATFIVNVQ